MASKLNELATPEQGSPDDIRVFIKDEPHSKKKRDEKRLRLIMALSLEDQVVDRLIFSPWSDAEQLDPFQVPGKTGWVPIPFGYRKFNSTFVEVLATDCSSFDWTVPPWAALMVRTLMLQQGTFSERFKTIFTRRFSQVLGPEAVVRLPDGMRLQQTSYGLMKSGWFRTIGTNSDIQFLIHTLAWIRSHSTALPPMWTLGDDVAIGWSTTRYDQAAFERALATTGIRVKHGKLAREFGGFKMHGSSVEPLYPDKHLFLLKHVSPYMATQVADAYMLVYALDNSPHAEYVRTKLAPHATVSPARARLWAHGVVGLL